MFIRSLYIVAALLLFSSISFAQDNEIALDPVTITASLSPLASSKTGRNIIVVKGEQFIKLPVHSVDELLRFIPGFEVQSRGPMGAQSDFVIRGGTFQQCLVLLDGVRLNDPNTGHFNSYIPIAPEEIDRIEVLKGASSAIYGSEAVGGVIHIITKSFAAKKGTDKQELSAQLTGGEYNLRNINAGGLYQHNKTAVSAGIVSNNSNGQLQRGIRGYFHNTTASASINQYLTDNWQLSFRTAYDNRDFAAQNFYTTFASDTATEKVTSFWNQLRLGYQKNTTRFSVDVGYKKAKDHYQFNSLSSANENTSNLLQALALYEWMPSDKTTIISGTQFINKNIISNDRGNHTVNEAAVFTTVNQRIGEHFLFNPALRLQWNERYGWELVPQANLSYKWGQWQLRGSAGKTIRDADFTERFNNYNKVGVKSGRIGNPGLEAERSFSYEAGMDYYADQKLKIGTSFFQRYHTNLIDYVTTPYADIPRKENIVPTGTYAFARNIANVITTGAELDFQYTTTFNSTHQLWATLGLVWLQSKSSEATPSFYISSHARFLTNFSVQYAVSCFNFSVTGIYKERAPQLASPIHAIISQDYFVVNAKAEALVWKKGASLFVEEDNIGNRQYSDLLGATMPGRWLMGGIKISLFK